MTDIKEVIARLKPFLEVAATYDSVKVTPADFRTLMHAAEAGIAARDAALEEALSASGVIDFLRFEVEQAGGQKEWALANGVSPQLVNDVLHGRRAPSAKICKPLGLVRTTRYVRAPRGAA